MDMILYSAIYTHNSNGKCQEAGTAFMIKFNGSSSIRIRTSTDESYGRIWLKLLLQIINVCDHDDLAKQHIKLIVGQSQTEKMAGKIERILCEAIRLTKPLTETDISKLVHKDGRYSKRPNDDLYTAIIFKAWQILNGPRHIYLDYYMMPCNQTMSLVKQLHDKISPQKKLFKKKPKKAMGSKAEAPL